MNAIQSIEYLAAGRLEATGKELGILARHNNPLVRRRVAEHKNSPPSLLLSLLQDENAEVRLAIANNQNATLNMLETLAKDESVDVRFGVAENPLLPLSLLTTLCNDENPYVASRAKTTLARIFNNLIMIAA